MANRISPYYGDASIRICTIEELELMELSNPMDTIERQVTNQTLLKLREVVGHVHSIQSLYHVLTQHLLVENKNVDEEVSSKMMMSGFNKTEAVADVFIDCILKRLRFSNETEPEGAMSDRVMSERALLDEAMLEVVSSTDIASEMAILLLADNLIERGAIAMDDSNMTRLLQHAVERNFKNVVKRLLQINVSCLIANEIIGIEVLETAIDNANDDICVILIHHIPVNRVHSLFENTQATNNQGTLLHRLISRKMQKSILSVLDCIVGVDETVDDNDYGTDLGNVTDVVNHILSPRDPTVKLNVYYNILESDTSGRLPVDEDFNINSETPFQMIAKMQDKDIICHAAVQGLMKAKWNSYGKSKFLTIIGLYLFNLFCITFSAIVAAEAQDPKVYDSSLQYARAVFEIISLLTLIVSPIIEIYTLTGFQGNELKWRIAFNILDISKLLLIVVVPPLRFTDNGAQWHVFAFGYFFYNAKIISLGLYFRHTGVYLRVISQVVLQVFSRMLILIIFVLIMFSGTFFLALRGDNDLNVHNETSTYGRTFIVGVRSLIEDNAVVEYSGDNGYKALSGIVMGVFLVVCIVIFFNLLIAEVTDTHHKIQTEADRNFAVSRMETLHHIHLTKDLRRKYYVPNGSIDSREMFFCHGNTIYNDIRDMANLESSSYNMKLAHIHHRLTRQRLS